jgi:serine phosphatase RsbU (regulator of sigma subunit)
VLATGEPELIEDVSDDALSGAARDPEHLEALRALGLSSTICVPLRARGRTLATLLLGCAESGRRCTQADLDRAMDLATIAGVALDNIRLLQQTIEQERRTEEARAQLERAHERTSFVSQAGALLESSLDIGATLADVAGMLVPRFADLCTIDVLGTDGSIRRLGPAAADPALQEALSELVSSYPLDPDGQHPVARVLRTGRPELISELGDEILVPIAIDARHLELMRRAVGRTALLVPLRAHGRTVGAMSLRWLEPNHAVDPDDAALLEDLAARIALAADNARIYEERDSVARTLARSLLPTELPDIPGFDVGAHYLPATREAGISGDFYDVFGLRDGRWVIMVGDVCGKGATAASLTALARHTLRTAALTARRPGRVLELLNESMLSAAETGRFCTVAYAQLEPRPGKGGWLTVACGGHPAPVVLRNDGTVETVGAVGTIIGAFPDLSLREAGVALAVGDTLVMFTDGVTEAGTGTDLLGERGLEEILLGCLGRPAAQIAECVAARSVAAQHGEPRDDIAVLALRAVP